MTLAQFIRQECSNWRDGKCCGLGIGNDGRTFRWRQTQPCNAKEKPCCFFEECVAPIADLRDDKSNQSASEAVDEYRTAHRLKVESTKFCPECGVAIGAFQRRCQECRQAREKAKKKERQSRWLKSGV